MAEMATTDTPTHDAARAAEQVTNNVQDLAAGVKDRALELKQKYVDSTWLRTSGYVRDNPGKALLVSAALGVVLGALLRRRS